MDPKLDDNEEDLRSSEQVTDVNDTAAPAEGVAAEPSTATGEPESLLSVVRDVLKTDDPASPAEKDPNAEGDDPEAALKGEGNQEDDPDYSSVPFNKHPRFQELLKKSKDYEKKVADLEPAAAQFRNIDGYMRQNSISAEEAADALDFLAEAKKNPAAALARIKPMIQQLLVASGEVLPDDLKQRVQGGEMPVDAAREVSRSRAALAQQEALRSREQEVQQEQRMREHAQQLGEAAQQWAADRNVKDPSFKDKFQFLQSEVALLQRTEPKPQNAAEVQAQLTRAYANVTQRMRAFAPAQAPRPALRPVMGGAAPGNQSAQPTSMQEAVRLAVRGNT